MCDMCKKCGYLPLRVIRCAGPSEFRVRPERRQKCITRVKPFANTTSICLANDTIKERLRDYICHRHVIGRWRGVAWALLAASAAIIVPSTTIAVLAAAEAI